MPAKIQSKPLKKIRANRTVAGKQNRTGPIPISARTTAGETPSSTTSQVLTRAHWAIATLLVVLTVALCYRATQNPFVNFDDQQYVIENAHVQQGMNWTTVQWAFRATEADNWHPLTWLSHALDCQLYGLQPAGHHFTSILLHGLNAGILFLLLAAATRKIWRSLLVAALFAVHPFNVESFAWIAERKNVLSMFFFLLTLGAYGWYARRPGVMRYLAVAALFALGLMAKPMIVTLPFVLLLVDFWPLQRVGAPSAAFPAPRYSFARLVLEKVPLLFLSVASCAMTIVAQQGAIAPNQRLSYLARVLNAIYAYSAYLWKGVWPLKLAAFYPYEGLRMGGWLFLFSVIVLAVASYLVWRTRSRVYPVVGWLWFLGTLVPVIGIVQVGNQAMADRYAYLPLIGIFCVVVWGSADFIEERQLRPLPFAIGAGTVLAFFSILTWRQIAVWDSSFDLWSHALQVTKDNFLAEDYIGTSILLHNYETTGQRFSADALVHFQNAVRIEPADPISHLNLGADLHEHGQFREAIAQYQTVLTLTQDPHLVVKALIDLGAASHQLGDYAAARQYYREVLKIDPRNRVVFENMGKLAMDERIQQLSAAAEVHPTAQAYLELGQLQQSAGHSLDARASFQKAVKIDPTMAEAKQALGSLGNL